MGQEERKNKAKMEKTQIQLASTSNEYEAAVKVLEETTGRWNRDWKAACDVSSPDLRRSMVTDRPQKFQDLEEERLDFTKSSLWTFANVASTVCVSDDAVSQHYNTILSSAHTLQSCEKIRVSLESCEVEKDIISFIQEKGTGQEIPDPPKYINFCRGDLNDTASEPSEDDQYSVAQFQRTINPAFRTSSPQPSTYESHHDPQGELAKHMGLQDVQVPPGTETTLTPQKVPNQPPPQIDYRRQAQSQAQLNNIQTEDFAKVPHNDYPTDGMTMFCRTAPPSDRSSAASPIRPSSRDSQSEYSNPTSFSSQEPASGKQSPVKQSNAVPALSPTKQVQKKRSGFFSNSPFRRKSKHEREPPIIAPPESQNTYDSNGRGAGCNAASPSRRHGQSNQARFRDGNSGSPEPADPRANFQLNVGNNVFDVASPDSQRNKSGPSQASSSTKDMDPIAQALAELKGIGKQSSTRVSADRYHGIGTPGPGATRNENADVAAAQRGTPPPSYDNPPMRRLDAPQPAFTSAQMRQTTQKYTSQTQEMYGSSNSRPGTRGNGDVPRAASPSPMRSTSPRPGYNGQNSQNRAGYPRSSSPNPYGTSQQPSNSPTKQGYTNGNNGQWSRHTSPNTTPVKHNYANGAGSGRYSRQGSPGDVPRARSPQPQFARQERPSSSGGGMALQLSNGNQGGNQRARGASNARPMSYYGGQRGSDGGMQDNSARNRSKSVADGRQFTRDGRPILQFGRFLHGAYLSTHD